MSYPRIKKPSDLAQYREDVLKEKESYRGRVLLCMTGCRALGAALLSKAFREKIKASGLEKEIAVVDAGCHGQCSRAPVVLIEPQEYLYGGVKPSDIDEIIELTLKQGKPVERLCASSDGKFTPTFNEVEFYKHQRRDVLINCGRVDPKRIEDAIACNSYSAAAKALDAMSPEEVIEEVREAGLRGRGGAGFPTGVKWGFCRKASGDEKYLICNADEGDPGAFMDRALLEGVPHQVIEGMIIAAYAIGASQGYMYVRAEYPIAVEHINIAIDHAHACGLLGDNILDSDFCFDIEVRMGAGAFVCGEETALIQSLEGKRGMPSPRPPFPANKGFRGKPTNINNVETLAGVPNIILNGREKYRAVGTDGSKGTKIFALAGKVKETGLVEVPMGATLRQIVFDIGGGIPKDRKFKAAQMGGPSGGCVPGEYLDLPIDYDSVKEIGAIMGSGGLIVMDEDTCMVDVARFFQEFTQKESCGKCVPCRVGTRHMADILTRICEGKGERGDIEQLEELANVVKSGSLCGLGQTAPNPVLTTIRYFRDEYEAHIEEKRCPAGVCKALITYTIDADKCIACGRCKKVCPVNVITGEKKVPHEIDVSGCIRCGNCRDVCPVDAVLVS
jgi:NADH:ubiquinone oxidoreductase subunit F (NADH-binding)/(2Fe-2S) ferredoxin/ferredoxin